MIGTCRLLGTFLHPPPPLLSHPHHVDTYVDTDKQTTTRTKTGHGRCPIWFEYGAGAAGYLSLYLTLLLFQQSSYLSFWHAGECTILFFYSSYLVTDWDYLHLDLPPLWTSKRRRLSFTRLQQHGHACAFYRLHTFCMPLVHLSVSALFNLTTIRLSVTDTASSIVRLRPRLTATES